MNEHFPLRGAVRLRAGALRIDGDNNALAAELLRSFGKYLRTMDGRRIDADFIRTGFQDFSEIICGPNTATHRKWDKDLFRHPCGDIVNQVPFFMAGRDIQKNQLIRAHCIILPGKLHGITGITQVQEVNALDYAAFFNVQTGNNSLSQHSLFNCHKMAVNLRKNNKDRRGALAPPADLR